MRTSDQVLRALREQAHRELLGGAVSTGMSLLVLAGVVGIGVAGYYAIKAKLKKVTP